MKYIKERFTDIKGYIPKRFVHYHTLKKAEDEMNDEGRLIVEYYKWELFPSIDNLYETCRDHKEKLIRSLYISHFFYGFLFRFSK